METAMVPYSSMNKAAMCWLYTHMGDHIRWNEPMARHTSFRVGGPAEVFFTPPSTVLLADFVQWAGKAGIPYRIIGDGTNLLAPDRGVAGVVINLRHFRKIEYVAEDAASATVTLRVLAGVRLKVFCQFAARNGLEGMAFALGIPGTVGGGMMMNAGTQDGSMADVLVSATVMDSAGRIREIAGKDFRFGYRSFSWESSPAGEKAILLAGTFQLQKGGRDARMLRKQARDRLCDRRRKQPIGLPSGGCFFRNPSEGPGAGALIDRAGLKGMRIGGAEVSAKHANFIVNRKGATSSDILALAAAVRDTVHRKFGVDLKPEVCII
ncbi:MAG: UDP-N-acetylmuramate dehydrogenase [Thermodesulfobacteriota bacterium]